MIVGRWYVQFAAVIALLFVIMHFIYIYNFLCLSFSVVSIHPIKKLKSIHTEGGPKRSC